MDATNNAYTDPEPATGPTIHDANTDVLNALATPKRPKTVFVPGGHRE